MIEAGPAERAGTLALGIVTGVLHLPALVTENGATMAFRAQQLTAPDGSIALLVRDDSDLHGRLRMIFRPTDLPRFWTCWTYRRDSRVCRAPFGCRVTDERSLSAALTQLLDSH